MSGYVSHGVHQYLLNNLFDFRLVACTLALLGCHFDCCADRILVLIELDAFGFHLVNVCLHGLASILFARVAQIAFGPNGHPFVTISAILFTIHPIHVEAVRLYGHAAQRRLMESPQQVLLKFNVAVSLLLLLSHAQVSNVVGRAELLSAIFFLLSFLTYHKTATSKVRFA